MNIDDPRKYSPTSDVLLIDIQRLSLMGKRGKGYENEICCQTGQMPSTWLETTFQASSPNPGPAALSFSGFLAKCVHTPFLLPETAFPPFCAWQVFSLRLQHLYLRKLPPQTGLLLLRKAFSSRRPPPQEGLLTLLNDQCPRGTLFLALNQNLPSYTRKYICLYASFPLDENFLKGMKLMLPIFAFLGPRYSQGTRSRME